MVTYKAKGVVPDDHPWFGGVFTNATTERPLVDEADLLIGIGMDPVELIPRPWTCAAPIINYSPCAASHLHVPFAAQAVGEIPAAIRHLERHLPLCDWSHDVIRGRLNDQRARRPGSRCARVDRSASRE